MSPIPGSDWSSWPEKPLSDHQRPETPRIHEAEHETGPKRPSLGQEVSAVAIGPSIGVSAARI